MVTVEQPNVVQTAAIAPSERYTRWVTAILSTGTDLLPTAASAAEVGTLGVLFAFGISSLDDSRVPAQPAALPALLAAFSISAVAADHDCAGTKVYGVQGWQPGWRLSDGGLAGFAKMNINIDGYPRAYHPHNAAAGALIHLCNAGRIHLPDGSVYEGSESNATCTGKFMTDVERIKASGWKDATVGLAQWNGVSARDRSRSTAEP